MTQRVYHASRALYSPGQIVSTADEMNYFQQKIESIGKNWLEDCFERQRPAEAPSRRRAQYACLYPEDCAAFFSAERRASLTGATAQEPMLIYEVDMPNPWISPMRLVGWAEYMKEDSERLQQVINEYWNPTQKWRWMEYLDLSMTVVKQIEWPSDSEIGRLSSSRYWQDGELAKKLWPVPQ